MNFTVIDAPQRSDAWRMARLGRFTGSRASDMLATIKIGEAAARRDLRMDIVVELLTGEPEDDGYVSKDMQRGIDLEPAAFAAYEAATGQIVRRSGFLSHNTLRVGCSLDGHVGAFRGIIEMKCPKKATHFRYLRERKIPSDYLAQITHNLWVSDAEWCDFVSFDDRFPIGMRLVIIRVTRADVENCERYAAMAQAFLAEVQRDYESALTMADIAGTLREAATV